MCTACVIYAERHIYPPRACVRMSDNSAVELGGEKSNGGPLYCTVLHYTVRSHLHPAQTTVRCSNYWITTTQGTLLPRNFQPKTMHPIKARRSRVPQFLRITQSPTMRCTTANLSVKVIRQLKIQKSLLDVHCGQVYVPRYVRVDSPVNEYPGNSAKSGGTVGPVSWGK